MASKRVLRTWACGVAAVTVAALAAWSATSADARPRSCDGTAFLTWQAVTGGRQSLSIIDVESRRRTDVASLDFHVNAIGYSTEDDKLFGLSRSRGGVTFADAPHLISIDSRGTVSDTGPVRLGSFAKDGLGGAYSGDVLRGNLVVLSNTRLTSIDIDERRVVKQVTLDETTDELNIGDITAVPGSDLLYGLSTADSAVVSIHPATGAIERTPVAGLSKRSMAGAIFTGPDRRLHAVVNGVDGEAVMYRFPVPDGDHGRPRAVDVARWPMVTSADAAFCPAAAPRPQRPTPSKPSPSPADVITPSATPPTTPSTSPPSQRTRPQPHRPEPSSHSPGRPPGAAAASDDAESETPRRWIAVGAVVVGMAGAAGVKAAANRKARLG